jgi:AmmeMemoRadiSam system protein B
MHLPYIYKILSRNFGTEEEFPLLVPILVGNTSPAAEKAYGALLAPYLADPTSVFIISSDFCHWGSRFSYTYYLPSTTTNAALGISLKRRDKAPADPKIHESIKRIDELAMQAVESGSHEGFLGNLRETGNTVCGRHPIGVVMAAVEVLEREGGEAKGGRFRFVRYERSSEVVDPGDSSVSYASAYAVL